MVVDDGGCGWEDNFGLQIGLSQDIRQSVKCQFTINTISTMTKQWRKLIQIVINGSQPNTLSDKPP